MGYACGVVSPRGAALRARVCMCLYVCVQLTCVLCVHAGAFISAQVGVVDEDGDPVADDEGTRGSTQWAGLVFGDVTMW